MESDAFSMKKQSNVLRLKCSVQTYDWGIRGQDSRVARFFALNSGSIIDSDKPYAEFWMGTHDSGPSFLIPAAGENGGGIDSDSTSLKSWVLENPNVLGDKVVQKWGSDIPFLFKVLSVAKPLSIQAHPDKELAKELHMLQPKVYRDANHKPEMALAITEFEALCGFISLEELKDVLHTVPEIVEMIGNAATNRVLLLDDEDDEEDLKSALRSAFTQLMSASKLVISKATSELKRRLHSQSEVRQLTAKEVLVLSLEKQYPDDVGVIAAFFLNYVKLSPGEALYLGANEPHAYIRGECIECMATSDNVVRAGLTPKFRDVQTLCAMLTYKQGFPEILQGVPMNPYITKYIPPFDEFEIDRCVLPKGESVLFPASPGPSIFLVAGGEGMMLLNEESHRSDVVSEGDVLFVPAQTEINITSEVELLIFRTGVNNKFFDTFMNGKLIPRSNMSFG
ncbi:mannose-6-phosphate isomerase 1-like isoform X2 [Benincasa hispida]|uniref:mannose-6-phosphate isomerase 1-like isoform X2 n=1 Tax=Benincasa hispida TaxID=102211 RepID=UPI0019022618|nr:mannose-6-phosphate isomerase 1-like isoform X2 [Benincasa hispida]